jgi:putative transcriptional regulator
VRNRVRELRLEGGLTQEEVADRVGVSRQTIISIESGRYNPSILLAYKLSRLFAESVEDLFLLAEQSDEEEIHG